MSSASSPLAVGSFDPLISAGPALVWTVVLTFVFLECALIVGLFLPGDSMLITAGIVMASHATGEAQVWALSVGAMIAAITGNQVGYVIGQRTGHRLVARKDGRYINTRNLQRVSELLQRHGFLAVLVARWIPWVRTLCPMVAGAAQMDHRKYTIASTIGAIIWAPVLLLIGFYAGNFLERVPWLMPAVICTLVLGLVIGTILGIRHYRMEMAKPAEEFDVDVDAPTVVLPRVEY
ncbi:membrane-associated protein [Nocardia amikacinitolerans]|uniref:Membrane-associated protein n=1 Tax=Nocardia amikacinitolerans TaxID=756689 RepID=A0A285LS29_9NOCA|nr:DedA family protein [Nocardia amikacinitolerans]MCP2276339.1 membrane-associated protein [Nocardia amikacinitolerans]MCP2291619.1 membrane-associated protein [Nocardia amikacinitolerans]MCP2295282.1 membrane-associated protein [Nocardia amikacinitolerans]SNY87709.1 membrane-associated protein [Nocardia amikacinitolerans]